MSSGAWVLVAAMVVGVTALCTIGSFVWVGRSFVEMFQEQGEPKAATAAYFTAVQAHDWSGAYT